METGCGIISADSGAPPLHSSRGNKFPGHAYPTGTIQLTGDSFQFTLDVSEFPPEDVIISYYNNRLDVHAEKFGKDGAVTNSISHQCKLPSNVDPLSVSMAVEGKGVLTVKAQRTITSCT